MPTLQRPALQRQLDGLVLLQRPGARRSPPLPAAALGMGRGSPVSLAARAKAVAEVRAAVDGFLGTVPAAR